MCIDWKFGMDSRLRVLPWVLLVWVLLLPAYYVVLWTIALSEEEPEHGCLAQGLGLPDSRAAARRALRTFHLWSLAVIALGALFLAVVVYSS